MSFQDIKGQDKPIQILKKHIEQSRLASGYLFTGPDGIGKRQVAKTLAKTLNCQNENLDTSISLCFDKLSIRPERVKRVERLSVNDEQSRTIDSCDNCISCLKIDKNVHPDVHIIGTEDSDSIKIEYIRQLQKDANLKPYEAKRKVFIIDNAHSLTAEASNAILKILEEPPQDCLMILVTAKPILLFKTIISRCQVLKFYPMARNKLQEILRKDYSLDDNLAHFLAYFCEGRLGSALRLKEKDFLREKNRVIDEFAFLKNSRLDNLPMQNRDDVRSYLNILASWFRDIYLIKIGQAHSELINFDRKTDLLKSMQRFSFVDLDEILNFVSDSMLYLEQNVNIKLLLSNLRMGIWR